MPTDSNNRLYKIPEIIGSLRTRLPAKPIVRIVEQSSNVWIVEICDGKVSNPHVIGYLCENNGTTRAIFPSRYAASYSIRWCSDEATYHSTHYLR